MKPLKKTRLSSSKEFVPTEDGSGEEEYQLIISVDADGVFYAAIPAHLHNVAEHLAEGNGDSKNQNHSYRKINYRDGFVTNGSKNAVMEDWKNLCWRIEDYLIKMVREKVIWYRTEMNIHYQKENGDYVNRRDNSFAKTNPSVGVAFRVCYKVGDKLVDEKNAFVADLKLRKLEGVIIPYTEERIQFLDKISEILDKAARQLNEFEEALQQNPLQIDTIMKRGFMLEYKAA